MTVSLWELYRCEYSSLSVENFSAKGIKPYACSALQLELCDFVLDGRAGRKLHLSKPVNADKQAEKAKCDKDFNSFFENRSILF